MISCMNRQSQVGLTELRRNLAFNLWRVRNGEILEVTKRGIPVAKLNATAEALTITGRLVVAGRATPPKNRHRQRLPRLVNRSGRSVSEIVMEMRADRI
jgi:prevent-host-death family protein